MQLSERICCCVLLSRDFHIIEAEAVILCNCIELHGFFFTFKRFVLIECSGKDVFCSSSCGIINSLCLWLAMMMIIAQNTTRYTGLIRDRSPIDH